MAHNFSTDQENFWAGEFGNDYINRNKDSNLLASNLNFFANALKSIGKPESLIEFGANVGMNLRAIRLLFPQIHLEGVEINETASNELSKVLGKENVHNTSLLNFATDKTFDVVLIKGVLIHINPDKLHDVYQLLYDAAEKYILICEYYNPVPVSIPYRGHLDKLFKRDFAGEMMNKYKDLKLINYGFVYRNDPAFPQDDITWFLLKK